MPIISLHQAHYILRSALLGDWLNNPLGEFGGRTPNEVIESDGLKPLIQRVSEILHIDLDSPILELPGPIHLELDRERYEDELIFEALISRLARLLASSWYDQSQSAFQGRTAKEVLRLKGGEEMVVEQIRQLAIDFLTKPTCVLGEYGALHDCDIFS